MKKILAGLALAAATIAPAAAADLAYRAPAPAYAVAPAPMFTWTGFYLGANAGYGWGHADYSDATSGFIGGVQAGYNWQAGNVVFGLETDIQASNIESPTYTLDYFGTVRGRLGYAVDQFLIYGTGGFAYGRGTYELGGLSNDQVSTGWTLGGGGEYAFSPNWSVKAEYLYVDLGKETYTSVVGPLDVGTNANILRAGVNYRF